MSKVTDSEVRLVLKTMLKVQDVALDYALSGYTDDYTLTVELIGLHNKLGEIIERNRKDAQGVSPPPRSKAVNNLAADLIIGVDTPAEQVDDMLAVTGDVTLKPGVIKVKVFHHDAAARIAGIRLVEFGDVVVSMRGSTKLIYTSAETCRCCGTPLDDADFKARRCLCCRSPIL